MDLVYRKMKNADPHNVKSFAQLTSNKYLFLFFVIGGNKEAIHKNQERRVQTFFKIYVKRIFDPIV